MLMVFIVKTVDSYKSIFTLKVERQVSLKNKVEKKYNSRSARGVDRRTKEEKKNIEERGTKNYIVRKSCAGYKYHFTTSTVVFSINKQCTLLDLCTRTYKLLLKIKKSHQYTQNANTIFCTFRK